MSIKVWPTKKSAVGLQHPHGPKLDAAGSLWPEDNFTARRLTDRSVSRDEADVYVEPAPEAHVASAPGTEAKSA